MIEHSPREITSIVSWTIDDPDAGLIDYVLAVYEDGFGTLTMNGQGHFPITAEDVIVLRREHA